MKPRLHLKPKNKVTVSTRLRMVAAVAAFAVVIAAGWLVYYNLGVQTDMMALDEQKIPEGYGRRMKLTLDPSMLRGGDLLVNYPLLVTLKHADLKHVSKGGSMIHPKAYDLRFTKSDGATGIPHEVEWYNGPDGELKVWLLLDTLKPSLNESMYLYFGNALQTKEIPPSMVWGTEYSGVWHFSGDMHARNNRKIRATAIGSSEMDGVSGKARYFRQMTNDCAFFDYHDVLDLKSSFTLSAWIQPGNSIHNQVILSNQGDRPGGYRMYLTPDNRLRADIMDDSGKRLELPPSSEKIESSKWTHVAIVFDVEKNQFTSFIDGIQDQIISSVFVAGASPAGLQIGRDAMQSTSYYQGGIDELRIVQKALSPLHLANDFNIQRPTMQWVKIESIESIDVNAQTAKAQKAGMSTQDMTRVSEKERQNQLKAIKVNASAKPSKVTSEPEALEARVRNIRRVSDANQ